MPKKYTKVECVFSLTLPKTSRKNAKKLMLELQDTIYHEVDNRDCLMESFDETFSDDDPDKGYSYGFGKRIKVVAEFLKPEEFRIA